MKQIRIGNQTSFSASPPTLPFEYAIENGFDAFEWFPDKKEGGEGWDTNDIDREMRQHIRRKAIENNIALSVHAPWDSNPLKPENHALLVKNIEFALDIGATILIVHLATDKGPEKYVKAIMPILRSLSEAGLRLSLENTPLTAPEDINRVFEIIQTLKDTPVKHVGMCLDMGHANLCASTRNDYLKFIDLLDSQVPINHIHLHENYGDFDSHLPVFTGPSKENDAGLHGFMKRLKDIHFSGTIILEQWPDPPSLLNEARKRLYHIWNTIPDTHSSSNQLNGTGNFKPSGKTVPDSVQIPANKSTNTIDTKTTSLSEKGEHNITRGQENKGDKFFDSLVEAHNRYRSWREKLNWVASLFKDKTFRPDTDQLIYLSIYLRFLGTGELACREDGSHFRPHHHAKSAHQIEECLMNCTTPDNAYSMRRIYPWLPSYDNAYTHAEPLTRIRDIAHRNDIPRELKNEIKHTLQNKLHRCAGPEDLLTSAALLERITAPDADLPASFVEEFTIFHRELKEFFNAHSLEERLESFTRKLDGNSAGLIQKFLETKKKSEETPQHYLTLLELLTKLRVLFIKMATDAAGADLQQFRLADIGLEDFLFVLLSRLLNILENKGDIKISWVLMLETLTLLVINVGLSMIETEECEAIELELTAWKRSFEPDQLQLLRLRATLERCRRLCEDYADRVLRLYQVRVEKLGRRLGVREEAIKLFCEGDIRGNIVFQLSKLVSFLLKHIRESADLSPWDSIVTGNATGRLVSVDCLDDIANTQEEEVILLTKKAWGDEIIPEGVKGIILGHQLPHLSHLGVRARKDGVVFAACEDEEYFRKLKHLTGKRITCKITAENVSWKLTDTVKKNNPVWKRREPFFLPEIPAKPEQRYLTIDQVNTANGGAKAYGARQLDELSSLPGSGFKTPPGLVVPFGVMEESIRAIPAQWIEYGSLIDKLQKYPHDSVKIAQQLRKILYRLKIHDDILQGIRKKFPEKERLMVRSSSNCEDTVTIAGAGLYKSIANVLQTKADSAIRNVWASLWSRNAVISRENCHIPHDKAHMAVLIQQMLFPHFSFIMHTSNPINHNPDELYVELAAGLGETLASGAAKGTPYRLICNKKTSDVQMLAFANFSYAMLPYQTGGVYRKRADYSQALLSTNTDICHKLGNRLAAIGRLAEDTFGIPQDIEGVIIGDDVYLVQSRIQQGINRQQIPDTEAF
ncbi:MAG: TIM barrel protein [Candidatus Scalindua sp.]|nr:TIM barrel protein [Candidatus Scalindua sp.]